MSLHSNTLGIRYGGSNLHTHTHPHPSHTHMCSKGSENYMFDSTVEVRTTCVLLHTHLDAVKINSPGKIT